MNQSKLSTIKILVILYLGCSNELQTEEKNSETYTEIILENGFSDSSLDVTSYDIENMTYNLEDISENITETGITDEEVTEMLNTSITTTISPTLTPEAEKDLKRSLKRHYEYQSSMCQCDLTKESCDVNCCCDPDCDDSDKQIFTECSKEILFQNTPNPDYCYSNNLLYKHDSPWLIDKKPNGLFCALKDNLPPILKSEHYKIYKTIREFDDVTSKHFGWTNRENKINKLFDTSKTYSYNDDIWIFNNSSLQLFKIPSRGINIFCSQMKTIKYMVNQKTFCISKFNESNILRLFENYENMLLVSSPINMNETCISNLMECPANVCIPLKAFMCDLQDCKILNKSELFLDSLDYLTSVKYELYSNGSRGYTDFKLYFSFRKIPQSLKYIEEHYEIFNIWIPKNNSKHARFLSGNPDYFNGMPIISSKLTKFKIDNTSEVGETFDFFISETFYPLKNVLHIPKNILGKCVLSNITYNSIKFKENIQTHCNVHYELNMKTEITINSTSLCADVQRKIFNFFSLQYEPVNVSKLFISVVGNPSKDFKDWIEVVEDKTAHIIKGTFKDNNSLICDNLVNSFLFQFVYAYVDQPEFKIKTVKLLGAKIKYELADSINLNIINNTITLPILVKTMFFDVSEPQNIEYAKGPQFHINLPNDFFYPFTYNSGGQLISSCIYVLSIFIVINTYF